MVIVIAIAKLNNDEEGERERDKGEKNMYKLYSFVFTRALVIFHGTCKHFL